MHYAYRCWRRQWGSSNARQCGGALVWQLNDCWPVISWALVDFFRVTKPAFYSIKRAMRPLAISVIRTYDKWDNGHNSTSTTCLYDVWISSDGGTLAQFAIETQASVEVELRFISIRTGKDAFSPQLLRKNTFMFNGTTTVCNGVQVPNHQGRDAFVIAAKLIVGGSEVSNDVDWPQPYKYISFADGRGLEVQLASSRTRIEVTSLRPTKGLIFAERPGLRFSDNGFDVMPGQQYIVDIEGLGEHEQLEWLYLGIDEEERAAKTVLTRA